MYKEYQIIIRQCAFVSACALQILISLNAAAESNVVRGEDEALSTVTVTVQRVANEAPTSLYATIATALRYDPEVDLQSRGLAEAQADVTIRGGVFENTAVALGAVTIHDPQTGHYTTLLPIDAEVLSPPTVITDSAHALLGFNATLATLAYEWRALNEQREIAGGAGSDALRFGAMAVADTHTDEHGTVTGIEARYAASASDGSRHYGDHAFERALLHAQRRSISSQTDVALAWQDSFFGWPGAYTGFASLPETDHTRTALLMANHRVELADGASDHGDSWVAFGAYYRDLEDDYDFDRRTGESGTPGSFEHRTRSYAAAVQGRHAGTTWAWRYGLQVSADELLRSTDLTHGSFDGRRYLKISVAPQRLWEAASGRQLRLRIGATLDASNRDEDAWLPLASLTYARASEAGTDALTLSFHASSQLSGYTALNSAPAGLFGGNAGLGRERTDSLSLRYERRRHDWLARVVAFVRQDDDLVDWTYLSGAPFARQANAVDLDVAGLETLVAREWPRAALSIGYAYVDKRADYAAAAVDASYYALNYARHRLTASLRYQLDDSLALFVDNELRRQVANPLRGSGADAYLAALALEWRPPAVEGLGVALIVDNLTNSNFEEFPGTPAARRQASLRLRYEW
jgi:hypothetical protein